MTILNYSRHRPRFLTKYWRIILLLLFIASASGIAFRMELFRRLLEWNLQRACLNYTPRQDSELFAISTTGNDADLIWKKPWSFSPADQLLNRYELRFSKQGLFASAPKPSVVFMNRLTHGTLERLVVIFHSVQSDRLDFRPMIVKPAAFWGEPQLVDQMRMDGNGFLRHPDQLEIPIDSTSQATPKLIQVFEGILRENSSDQFEIPIIIDNRRWLVAGALEDDGHVRMTIAQGATTQKKK